MNREQRLFSAAQLFRELHPVEAVNYFRKGTASYNEHQARLQAQRDLDKALSAYEDNPA